MTEPFFATEYERPTITFDLPRTKEEAETLSAMILSLLVMPWLDEGQSPSDLYSGSFGDQPYTDGKFSAVHFLLATADANPDEDSCGCDFDDLEFSGWCAMFTYSDSMTSPSGGPIHRDVVTSADFHFPHP